MRGEKGQDSFGQDKHHGQTLRCKRAHSILKGWMMPCRTRRSQKHGEWWCRWERGQLGLQKRQVGSWRVLHHWFLARWLLNKYVQIKYMHGWVKYQGYIGNPSNLRMKKKCLLCSEFRELTNSPTHHSYNPKNAPLSKKKKKKTLWFKIYTYARALLRL